MNIVWIAPPAAGKGTYSSLLKEKYGFNHISIGELLREEASKNTALGLEIKKTIDQGKMVDDTLVKELIENKLKTLDLNKPFMLDGYPRKLNQALDYEDILNRLGLSVDKVIFINIDKKTGLERALGRLNCSNCKMNYNTLTGYAPKKEGVCDNCGSPLIKRADDNKASYENRYDVYMNETMDVIEKYRKEGKLITIDGTKSREESIKEIENLLGVRNG